MKNLSEIHGVDLIRKVAREQIKKPALRSRVWSDEMNCWGFFSNEVKESDLFLIMFCSNPGDMFRTFCRNINLFDNEYRIVEKDQELYVILDLVKTEIKGSPHFEMNLLSSYRPMMCRLLADQRMLFKVAWALTSNGN